MQAPALLNKQKEASRLTLALIAAFIVHAVVILGIRFSLNSPSLEEPLSLNITLLEQPGGQTDTNPIVPAPVESDQLSTANSDQPTEPPVELSKPTPSVIAPSQSPAVRAASPEPTKALPPEMAKSKSPRASASSTLANPPSSKTASSAPNAVDLINRGIQMARLETNTALDASNSREKRINQESMTTLEKFYLQAWERKVERIGTLNFPEQARHLNLTDGPVLDVAIRSDGNVHSIRLVTPSRHPSLDSAGRQIVQLAAPFAPFPAELRRQYDILHIVRKWKFEHGKLLQQ